MTTLSEALDPRRNNLNVLRLVFAGMVLVAHSYALAGHVEPAIAYTNLGGLGVYGFFAISGYLIVRSRVEAPSGARYLWHRALRIYPSYWVCLLVTAYVFAPLAYLHDYQSLDGFPGHEAGHYALVNASLAIHTYTIRPTLGAVPFKGAWDGSLWTLAYEMACYLLVFALAAVGLLRRKTFVVILLALTTVAFLFTPTELLKVPTLWIFTALSAVPLTLAFVSGGVAYLFADRIPMHAAIAALTTVGYVVSRRWMADSDWIAQPALAYIVLWLGASLPFRGLFAVNDISYGVYIYAFPVQQILADYRITSLGHGVFLWSAVPFVIALGMLNRLLIEAPANRLKRWSPRRRSRPVAQRQVVEPLNAAHVETGLCRCASCPSQSAT